MSRTKLIASAFIALLFQFPAYGASEYVAAASAFRTEVEQADPGMQGFWTGEYTYADDAVSPVHFLMIVSTDGNTILGAITEPNTFGDPNVYFLRARIQGSIVGNSFQFTKTYDGTGGQTHSVQYWGTLDGSGTVATGEWSIDSSGGQFHLHLTQ